MTRDALLARTQGFFAGARGGLVVRPLATGGAGDTQPDQHAHADDPGRRGGLGTGNQAWCLSDEILVAFHQARDRDDVVGAEQLPDVLEFMTDRKADAEIVGTTKA
jgi:hypothetical protein